MLRFTTLALILAASTTAHADDLTDKYRRVFTNYTQTTSTLKHDPISPYNGSGTADDCINDIAKAKAEGLPADTVFKLRDANNDEHEWTFADIAKLVCAPYARAHQVSEVAKVLWESR